MPTDSLVEENFLKNPSFLIIDYNHWFARMKKTNLPDQYSAGTEFSSIDFQV
jgi:hypothetical protein